MLDNTINTPDVATPIPNFDRIDLRVIVQGLLYGIAEIMTLPPEREERSSMLAMCALVRRIMKGDDQGLAYTLWGVEHHVGHGITLWPPGGGTGPTGNYTDAEFEHEDAVRQEIKRRKERFEQTGALVDAPPSDVIKFIGSLTT